MPDLLFKEQELQNLLTFINNNVPTKYGMPIINFVEDTAKARAKEQEEEAPEEEKLEKD